MTYARALLLLLSVSVSNAQVSQDIRADVAVPGVENPLRAWADSYSVNGVCYCSPTLTEKSGGFAVPVGNGFTRVRTICNTIGPGPGMNTPGAVLYNTVQCGNAPATKNDKDGQYELQCPGQVGVGRQGCGRMGPKWDLRGKNIPQNKSDPPSADLRRQGITAVLRIDSTRPIRPRGGWKDSYSVNGRCYCTTTFDHNIGDVAVETAQGWFTVRTICDAIGPGPGENTEGAVLYNDVQCGHLSNDADDENSSTGCPGRVDIGSEGCGQIGPRWNLNGVSLPPQRSIGKTRPDAAVPVPPTCNRNNCHWRRGACVSDFRGKQFGCACRFGARGAQCRGRQRGRGFSFSFIKPDGTLVLRRATRPTAARIIKEGKALSPGNSYRNGQAIVGPKCELADQIDGCADSPCRRRQICTDTLDGFTCRRR